MPEPRFLPAAASGDVPPEGKLAVTVAGRAVLLIRHEGTLFALENRCSHADQALDCGRVRWGWIACPAHGAKFALDTGEPLSPPATAGVATFAVREAGGVVEVAL